MEAEQTKAAAALFAFNRLLFLLVATHLNSHLISRGTSQHCLLFSCMRGFKAGRSKRLVETCRSQSHRCEKYVCLQQHKPQSVYSGSATKSHTD